MRRNIYWLALLPTIVLAGVRAYDIPPVRDPNGWGIIGREVTQTLRCVFDSALYAEAFIGQVSGNGWYDFEIDDADGRKIYIGQNTEPAQPWHYVHAPLERYAVNPMPPKGTDLILKVKAAEANDSVNWYASDGNAYTYGQMTVPGRPVPGDYDLAARVEGITWNNAEMVSTWDLIPDQIAGNVNHYYPGLTQAERIGNKGTTTIFFAGAA
jgi:hypothetical protein